MMLIKNISILSVLFQLFILCPLRAQEATYIYPMAGQRGTVVYAEIGGNVLGNKENAVWFASGPEVFSLETASDEGSDTPSKGSRSSDGLSSHIHPAKEGTPARLQISIAPDARVGDHWLRFITPQGLSNSIKFIVTEEPVIAESDIPHDTPAAAIIVPVPALISGRIGAANQLFYYSLEVSKGEELTFHVESDVDTQLWIFETTGSWFDPNEITRLAFNDDPASHLVNKQPQLTYRFEKTGQYLVRVGSFRLLEGKKKGYLLRINQSSKDAMMAALSRGTFRRRLPADSLRRLWERTAEKPNSNQSDKPDGAAVASSEVSGGPNEESAAIAESFLMDPTADLPIVSETEGINQSADQAQEVNLPVIIEGKIDHPHDVDYYKFKAKAGQHLAFEIETPKLGPPLFNPRLGVFDESGNEFLTNIHKRITRNFTFYTKSIMPKTIYTFKLDGEYYLELRDITSRFGESDFEYRLLIRQQVPHMGGIAVHADCINLKPGNARKLTVVTHQEEGYKGEVAIMVENLPTGVHAVTGTDVEPDRGPPLDEGYKERFIPKRKEATILLMVDADAPSTKFPQSIQIKSRSIVDGNVGPPLHVRDIPIMIVGADPSE